MYKLFKSALIIICPALILLQSCGVDDKINPGNTGKGDELTIQTIKGVWIATSVLEDNVLVYSSTSTQNIRSSYVNFVLDFSSPPKVKITEFDGLTFEGQYSIENDNQLILTSLSPAPYGTEGKITYIIEAFSTGELILIRQETNFKTGGSLTKYTLKKK